MERRLLRAVRHRVRSLLRTAWKQPDERYASATELNVALERVEAMMNRRGWRRWLPR